MLGNTAMPIQIAPVGLILAPVVRSTTRATGYLMFNSPDDAGYTTEGTGQGKESYGKKFIHRF